jgi:hypothetical protein
MSATTATSAFARAMGAVARELLGEPNAARIGRRGHDL